MRIETVMYLPIRLLPDFFIPYSFEKKIIARKDLEEVIIRSNEAKVSFCYLIRDCNDVERDSYIKLESQPLAFDKNIDNYVRSSKLLFLPGKIRFIKAKINREYYDLHKDLILVYNGKPFRLLFKSGSYDIVQIDVLQNEWVK